MYECIVFDLDGTLLNTLGDLTNSVNFALRKYGLQERSQEEVRSFIGNGIKKLIERAVGAEYQAFVEAALADFKEYYGAHCAEKTCAYEGIFPLLAELKKRNIALAVVSNKADFAVKLLVEQYFKGYFDEVVGENESIGLKRKPAPDSLLAVLERLQKEKIKTVYVGDSEVDIQTATNAGIDCISATWGFKDEDFLIKNGAKKIARAPMEILEWIGGE